MKRATLQPLLTDSETSSSYKTILDITNAGNLYGVKCVITGMGNKIKLTVDGVIFENVALLATTAYLIRLAPDTVPAFATSGVFLDYPFAESLKIEIAGNDVTANTCTVIYGIEE